MSRCEIKSTVKGSKRESENSKENITGKRYNTNFATKKEIYKQNLVRRILKAPPQPLSILRVLSSKQCLQSHVDHLQFTSKLKKLCSSVFCKVLGWTGAKSGVGWCHQLTTSLGMARRRLPLGISSRLCNSISQVAPLCTTAHKYLHTTGCWHMY